MQEVFLARFLPVLGICAIVLSLAACATNTPGSVKDRSTWARWGYAEGVKNVASHYTHPTLPGTDPPRLPS